MSSQTKKTININPDLFKIGGDKTRKTREKKVAVKKPFVLNQNSIKSKLIDKIKQHKQTAQGMISSNNNITDNNTESKTPTTSNNNDPFQDEFFESMNYLSSLSSEPPKNRTKRNHNNHNRSKQHPSVIQTEQYQVVNLELPQELSQQPLVPVTTEVLMQNIQPEIVYPEINDKVSLNVNEEKKPSYTVDTSVPYGCLKGGNKPTYRIWNHTKKNYVGSDGIGGKTMTVDSSASEQIESTREKRLELLKRKFKQLPTTQPSLHVDTSSNPHLQTKHIVDNVEQKEINNDISRESIKESNRPGSDIINAVTGGNNENNQSDNTNKPSSSNICEDQPIRRFIKKTIRRKYTLGKSKIYKRVSILIKDNATRKQIINAHRELKRKPINEIKEYLKHHGLLKAGSNAPNDVIRQIYESVKLSGDITNNNKDTLIHNLLTSSD
jgi:hypothetical protein